MSFDEDATTEAHERRITRCRSCPNADKHRKPR